MITLRTCITALAFFTASELFEFAVQLFDLPAQGILLVHILRSDRTLVVAFARVGAIGNQPVNVAVWGHNLEKSHQKRQILEFDQHTVLQTLRRPFHFLEMNEALLLTHANQSIALESLSS